MILGLLAVFLSLLVGVLIVAWMAWRNAAAMQRALPLIIDQGVGGRISSLEQSISQRIAISTADMAERVEKTKGDIRQEMSDRLGQSFETLRGAIDRQLIQGREEQARRLGDLARGQGESLAGARTELTNTLALMTEGLKQEFQSLGSQTRESIDGIRREVNDKLLSITNQVQDKLSENIREGIAQFDKVQQHLKAAEEQLRNVGAVSASINNLNNLLQLPHMRGRFGEQSLERLLADFLPSTMYELQASPSGNGGLERADAVIIFPEARLPIDAKFPRDSMRGLFDSCDEAALREARAEFARVIKEQARRISAYIQPHNGTTEMALMYLPSETLYFETIRDADLSESLNRQHVFPISPNTLIVTLRAISMVHSWYQVAQSFKKTREELAKATQHFTYFQKKFESIGKSLDDARGAYDTAARHLSRYSSRVTGITGEEPDANGLEGPVAAELPPLQDDDAV